MTPRIAISAAILALGFCGSVAACTIQVHAQNIDAPPVDYRGEIFRPSPALSDWFEHLMRPNWEKELVREPGAAHSCCDAGDAYPIVILQEASIGGTEPNGIAEVTDTSARMIIKSNGERKWRPEWKMPIGFHFAGEFITREIDGNPTKTAWVFAGGTNPDQGIPFKLYCVVPIPPGF